MIRGDQLGRKKKVDILNLNEFRCRLRGRQHYECRWAVGVLQLSPTPDTSRQRFALLLDHCVIRIGVRVVGGFGGGFDSLDDSMESVSNGLV